MIGGQYVWMILPYLDEAEFVNLKDGSPNSQWKEWPNQQWRITSSNSFGDEHGICPLQCRITYSRLRLPLVYCCHSARGGGENAPDGLKAESQEFHCGRLSQTRFRSCWLWTIKNGGSRLKDWGIDRLMYQQWEVSSGPHVATSRRCHRDHRRWMRRWIVQCWEGRMGLDESDLYCTVGIW